MSKFLLSVSALLCLVTVARSAEAPADSKAKAYPLTTCIVTDEKLGNDAVMKVYDGQEIKFCCKKCFKDFEKDQATYLKKIEGGAKASGDKPAADKHGDHQHDK